MTTGTLYPKNAETYKFLKSGAIYAIANIQFFAARFEKSKHAYFCDRFAKIKMHFFEARFEKTPPVKQNTNASALN